MIRTTLFASAVALGSACAPPFAYGVVCKSNADCIAPAVCDLTHDLCVQGRDAGPSQGGGSSSTSGGSTSGGTTTGGTTSGGGFDGGPTDGGADGGVVGAGHLGHPCGQNADCASGYCVEVGGGQ